MARFVALLFVLCLFAPAAAPGSEPTANPQDPETNFEYDWRSINRKYGQFGGRNVDWAMLYRIYRPQVTPATTNEELCDVPVTMLGLPRSVSPVSLEAVPPTTCHSPLTIIIGELS